MTRTSVGVLLAGVLSLLIACAGSTDLPPSAASCDLTIDPGSQTAPPSGGSFRAMVTSACAWTATTSDSWIAIGNAQGSGVGIVTYTVQPNRGANSRQGRMRIAQLALVVTQDAGDAEPTPPPAPVEPVPSPIPGPAPGPSPVPVPTPSPVPAPNPIPDSPFPTTDPGPCPASVDPGSVRVKASGETVSFLVSAPADCKWSVSTGMSWIALETRLGVGSVRGAFVVGANVGFARSGSISVAGQTISVSQDAAPAPVASPCPAAVEPASVRVKASGEMVNFAVSASADCTWSVSTGTSWIALTTRSGAGSATGTFRVAANDGPARSGNVDVGGRMIVVTQDAVPPPPPCPTTVEPRSVRLTAAAQEVAISISASADCKWSVGTDAAWIGVPMGSFVGSGTSKFGVKANDGSSARSGSLKIGGLAIAVTQDAPPPAPCPASVEPRSVRLTAAAQDVSFSVSASADCKWSVTGTDMPWIGIPTGSVTGSGASRFGVKANDGSAARSGSVRIGGLAIAVTQDPPKIDPPPATTCIVKLNLESVAIPVVGGSFRFTVTLANGCRWLVENAPAWLKVTPSSGSGTTDVSVVVDRNPDRLGRTEQIVVSGRTITVSQAGVALR